MRPIIGITPSVLDDDANIYKLNKAYHDAVSAAGGLPIILTYEINCSEYLQLIDGLLLSGGGDVDPPLYGADTHPLTNCVDIRRDRFEIDMINGAIEADIPILGICRGLQILNITLGGDLIQHAEGHSQANIRTEPSHAVTLLDNTKIKEIFGKEYIESKNMPVNSTHHQVVGVLSEKLRLSGMASDGVIEAAEMPDKDFVLGVQWHPEALLNQNGEIAHSALFEAFVSAAMKYKSTRGGICII